MKLGKFHVPKTQHGQHELDSAFLGGPGGERGHRSQAHRWTQQGKSLYILRLKITLLTCFFHWDAWVTGVPQEAFMRVLGHFSPSLLASVHSYGTT